MKVAKKILTLDFVNHVLEVLSTKMVYALTVQMVPETELRIVMMVMMPMVMVAIQAVLLSPNTSVCNKRAETSAHMIPDQEHQDLLKDGSR